MYIAEYFLSLEISRSLNSKALVELPGEPRHVKPRSSLLTCFYNPPYIIRYLELIGKTLRYYCDKPKRFLKLKDRISLERSNKILNKAYRGCYRRLADVFRTDESIARLFKELAYLVERKLKSWLGCVYTLYALGTISKQELFANIVAGLKE